MKKRKGLLLSAFVLSAIVISSVFLMGATVQRGERTVTMTAVDSTPLDGSSTSRTYQAADRTVAYCVVLAEETDYVVVTAVGTGSDNNSAVFTLWGYGVDGDAERIYHTVTATLGTAVAGSGKLYVDYFNGTDTHTTTIAVKDSGSNGNTRAKFYLETAGLRHLMFEPTTFTTLTAITFHVREFGYK